MNLHILYCQSNSLPILKQWFNVNHYYSYLDFKRMKLYEIGIHRKWLDMFDIKKEHAGWFVKTNSFTIFKPIESWNGCNNEFNELYKKWLKNGTK